MASLATYLATAGGHAYSTDGTFAFEMAKSAVLDPDHQYWGRFRTAFARWGIAMPAVAQPFVLAGAAIGSLAPERDDLDADGHRFRIEEWPPVRAGEARTLPLPADLAAGDRVRSVRVVGSLSNAAAVPDGATVAEVRLHGPDGAVSIPVRAGVDASEWAWDRPDVRATVAHRRAEVVGHWVGQPRGNLYVTRLEVDPPVRVTAWTATGGSALGASGAWDLRAAAFEVDAAPADTRWRDARTGDRIWSERQSRDFWAQLGFGATNAFVTAAAVLMTWRVAGALGHDGTTRLVTAAGFAFATLSWPYAKLDFSEPLAALAILVAADAILRAFPPGQGAASGPSPLPPGLGSLPPYHPGGVGGGDKTGGGGSFGLLRPAATCAIACLVAVAAKYAAVAAVAALAGEWAVVARPWAGPPARRRRALAFGAAALAPIVALGAIALAVLWRATGEVPVLFSAGLDRLGDDWFTLPFWTGLRGLLISSGKGLFVHAPWLLLSPVGACILVLGAWRTARQHASGQADPAWHGLVMRVAYPVATVAAYSMKLVWHGGAWGPRYLVIALPWMALACAPVVARAWASRTGRAAILALGTASMLVQLVAVAKHPEQFTAMARRHVLAALPRFGADLGGRDYWDARGGEGLRRALRDEASGTARIRSLGYLWGFPDATATVQFREARDVRLGIYAVDWDRRSRTQEVTIEDALGVRALHLGEELAGGVWIVTTAHADPGHPLIVRLRQTGPDTAVLSAITFDPPGDAGGGADARTPRLDRDTGGDWPGRHGADGRIFPGFRSFNIDEARLPPYVAGYALDHVGDRPHPTIHVEIAEDDLLDTAILYAPPFSPLLGNAWLIAADLLHLLVPSRPDLADGVLIRPPWHWFGIDAPALAHPEYGLGLDFWPTIIWTNYASHQRVVAVAAAVLLLLEVVAVAAVTRLLAMSGVPRPARTAATAALVTAWATYDVLMVLP